MLEIITPVKNNICLSRYNRKQVKGKTMGKIVLAVGLVVVGAAIGYAVFSSLSDDEKEQFFDQKYPSNI
jgi:hypothetical protein